MVSPAELRSAADGPASLTTRVAGVDDPVRLLTVPVRRPGESLFVVVGSTLGDRNESLARLTLLLAVFGSAALAIVSFGGWILAVLKMDLDLAAANATDPEEIRLALLNASAEADRLVRLAEDLLVLARVRGGRLPVRRMPVDLHDLVGNVCTAYASRASAEGRT